jgi:hypothetical protein
MPEIVRSTLPAARVDDAHAVVAEVGNKQPLAIQIDAEMVDPAVHLAERDLGLQDEWRARHLRRARGGQHYAREKQNRAREHKAFSSWRY